MLMLRRRHCPIDFKVSTQADPNYPETPNPKFHY